MENPPFDKKESEVASSNEQRVQRFQFGPWVFNVKQAREIIAQSPREPRMLPVPQWAHFYGLDSPEGESFSLFTPHPSFDRSYAMTTDLSEPVIVATLRSEEGEEFPLLIDGTHRLYRARTERVAELPAYVLTAEESLTIREDGFAGSYLHWPSHDRARLPNEGAGSGDGGEV